MFFHYLYLFILRCVKKVSIYCQATIRQIWIHINFYYIKSEWYVLNLSLFWNAIYIFLMLWYILNCFSYYIFWHYYLTVDYRIVGHLAPEGAYVLLLFKLPVILSWNPKIVFKEQMKENMLSWCNIFYSCFALLQSTKKQDCACFTRQRSLKRLKNPNSLCSDSGFFLTLFSRLCQLTTQSRRSVIRATFRLIIYSWLCDIYLNLSLVVRTHIFVLELEMITWSYIFRWKSFPFWRRMFSLVSASL